MDIVYFSNEFPKEDLQDALRQLHKHSKERRHYLLAHFLSEATHAVKHEVAQLPGRLRELIPPFQSLFSWAEDAELREGLLCGSIDGVLLVLLELGAYIRCVRPYSLQ